MIKRSLLCLLMAMGIFSFSMAGAEIKVFEKETLWRAAKNQSQEQAEGLAKLDAQRQAIEEAGVFISSLPVVKNFKLEKDAITQLASGILKTKTVGEPTLFIDNGSLSVRVKTVIQVDTAILDRQVETFMKDKEALKKEEEAMKKVRELQEQLTNLKSTDVQRIEELNAQALAMEREKNKQRLIFEEQALKSKGELSRAEMDRLEKERELQERINRTLAEQMKDKRAEAAALAVEQNQIRRASLENEQRWNDLSRRAKLAQESWVAIDDNLSISQATDEVKRLKTEIANLKNRLDFQHGLNTANIKNAYAPQRALTTAKLPPEPAPRDDFEPTAEYSQRRAVYERQLKEAVGGEALRKLQKEETLKLAEAKVEYLAQQIRVLTPFVERLGALQARKFTLPEGGAVTVDLGAPDADNNRFPVKLQYNGKSWPAWWNYTDRNSAKDFYRTRTQLKAEGLFQIEETANLSPKITAAKVTQPATKEAREFALETPRAFSEIDQFALLKKEEATVKESQKESRKKAEHLLTRKEIAKEGRFIAYDDGTVLDTQTNLMWAARDNGKDINWSSAKSYCESYREGGYTDWRMPTQNELERLYDSGKSYKVLQRHYNVHLTALVQLSASSPWASQTRDSEAAYFDFFNSKLYWTDQSYSLSHRALPVRSEK